MRIDDVTLDEAAARAAALIAQGGAHQIATVNPEFIMLARDQPAFRAALARTALNVPDGVGVLRAAAWLGHPLRERVAGVELVDRLCRDAAARGWPVFLLGAAEGVAARAGATLARRHSGLQITGVYAGTPAEADAPAIIDRIRAARPALLFVAYGAPAQDVWLARHLASLSNAGQGLIGVGVGGTFDFLTGVQQRAPDWIRRAGFEWLYRLIRQPARWRRQLSLARFVAAVLVSGRAS